MTVQDALAGAGDWPVDTVAAAVVDGAGGTATHGDTSRPLPWASVTKLVTALAVLVAVEEETVSLDDPAGPDGSTVRHLLAHASGLGPDERRSLAAPGERRIYSNTGFEILAEHVADRSGMPFADYLGAGVLAPLGLERTTLEGSPAWGAVGPVDDLVAVARELLAPRLLARSTIEAATTVAFPGLAGVLPGFGRQEPNDWGLGLELRDAKAPHWTGSTNSPATFGHFGRAGGFLWVDPVAGIALGCLTDREFGPWAARAWPALSDAVLESHRSP